MAEAATSDGRKTGTWVIVWGVLLIVTGFLAILQPAIAALAFELLLGWLLVFAGIVQIVYAIQERGKDGFGLKILSAILTLLLGIFLLVRPVAGIASIALLIGAFMLASGVSSVMLAFKVKPRQGWGWVLFDGILSIVIAAVDRDRLAAELDRLRRHPGRHRPDLRRHLAHHAGTRPARGDAVPSA